MRIDARVGRSTTRTSCCSEKNAATQFPTMLSAGLPVAGAASEAAFARAPGVKAATTPPSSPRGSGCSPNWRSVVDSIDEAWRAGVLRASRAVRLDAAPAKPDRRSSRAVSPDPLSCAVFATRPTNGRPSPPPSRDDITQCHCRGQL